MTLFNESGKHPKRSQLYAMLYKKMLNQAPKMIPIVMLIVAVVVIIFLTQLSSVLRIKLHNFTKLNLGLPDYESSRKNFDKYLNCTFIEAVRKPHQQNQLISKYSYVASEFVCGKNDYLDYLKKDTHEYDRLGATSFDAKSNTFTVWVNRRIFHSAIVAINLAHNLMLRFGFIIFYINNMFIIICFYNNMFIVKYFRIIRNVFQRL